MRLVRIGVGAISVKVGDFAQNRRRLSAVVKAARDQGVHLLVTPELAISGYSLEDRLWWPEVTRRSWDALLELAGDCAGISVFVGLPVRHDSLMYNAAALIHDRQVRGLILKKNLPTYSIFYEGRHWTPQQVLSGSRHVLVAGETIAPFSGSGRPSPEIRGEARSCGGGLGAGG